MIYLSLNNTPTSERLHIGIFGKRNAGKSSVINAVTGQDIAIVSDVKGTTTDPVYKSMELLPIGPVVIIDTPGIDDDGELGKMRVAKSYQVLNKTDLAILVVDCSVGLSDADNKLLDRIKAKEIPYIVVMNKADMLDNMPEISSDNNSNNQIWVSTANGKNIHELKELIGKTAGVEESKKRIVADLLAPDDFVVLVVPIDSSAPKGRLILPQQQTIRDILDSGAISVVTRDTELVQTLEGLKSKPKMVITDSQAFGKVSKNTPKDIMLTSFSILFARYKGNLKSVVKGAKAIESLNGGDTVLISEGCTHHRQCNDIGTVKLPNWIRQYTGKDISFEFTSGTQFPEDLSKYKMIVHCGGCMLNECEMKYRLRYAEELGVPITNYGILIAYINGILKRSLEPFPDILKIID